MGPDPARRACLALLPAGLAALALSGCETLEVPQLGPTLSDDDPLSQAVLDALAAAPETTNERIHVKTLNPGVVRLSGNVDQDITRTFAAQIAERVSGVERVVNTLFIRD